MFKKLRSATDLALRAAKAPSQAIGHAMASLVMLERHLWLNLTEIKAADRTALLDSPVSLPVRLHGGRLCGMLHRGPEVIAGYASLLA